MRGLALMLEGQPQRAVEHFDRALALQPDLSAARLNRAISRLQSGDAAAASAELQKIADDDGSPLRASAAYHNALALDRLGQGGKAEEWIDRALALDPKLDAALLYRGVIRERQGDLQGAGRAYLDYVQRHPDSVMAMLRLGLTAQRAGRTDVAQSWLQRVVAAAPDSPEAEEARKFLVMWE